MSDQPLPRSAILDESLGRTATSPMRMPLAAWKQVLKRVWDESGTDNVSLMAAGVAFYGFLSIVPAVAAVILTYGLFASPETIVGNMAAIAQQLPSNAATVVNDQLLQVATTSRESKGWGLLVAILIAIYGATKGIDAIVTALNVAYDEEEKRGFFARTALVLVLTAFSVVFSIVALASVSLLHLPGALFPMALTDSAWLMGAATYVILVLFGIGAAAIFFRFAPSRKLARWRWLTVGSVVTSLLWLLITSGFAAYTSQFGDYGATYGSLAGVVALLTWLYFTAYALIIGAEINAELEHQTARDTTVGPDKPLGQRRAVVADTVAGQ